MTRSLRARPIRVVVRGWTADPGPSRITRDLPPNGGKSEGMQMSGSHIVEAGDTLGGIAEKYGLKLDDLVRWNNIDNPDLIRVGQKVELSGHQPVDPGEVEPGNPSPMPSQGQDRTYVVKSGDTLGALRTRTQPRGSCWPRTTRSPTRTSLPPARN